MTRWEKMIEKHGSEEAAKEAMRQMASLSSRNSKGTGGFAKMKREDPELLKQISAKGGSSKKG